jgi:hypothetical protein
VKYQTGAMCGGVFSGSAGIEVRRLQEVATTLWCEEHDSGEDHEENHDADDILHRVIRVEWDAVTRNTVFILVSP